VVSSDVYFVLIKDFQHKNQLREVVEWLEESVVLGHGEAEQLAHNLPFDIPMGFPSKEEAKEFTTKLRMYGCILEYESLTERNARAERARERSAAAAAEPPPPPQQPSPEEQSKGERGKKRGMREKKGKQEKRAEPAEGGGQSKRLLGPVAGIAAAVLAVLGMALFGYQQMSDGGGESETQVAANVDPQIVSQVKEQMNSGSPFSQVVANMQRHIEQKNYSSQQRIEHSGNYMGAVKGEQPVKNRETRQHNITMAQVAIAFYRKNKKAWKRLVAEYQMIGATLKVEELRKEMVELFGEEETIEILEENG
jgi:hypothetical protein